ncbi:MAG TPA: FAD binding domain-containing protein [Thermoplasmata archaeon]|nr:FAD binding domain-containing protein [Thermoplasmata archaeon]
MLRLAQFDLHAPRTLDEAVRLIAESDGQAAFVGGGTDLYPAMKRGLVEPKSVVSLRQVRELRGIRRNPEGGFIIGAMTTLQDLVRDRSVAADHPALTQAAGLVANPQIRAMATVGGNLCSDTRCNYYDQSYLWRRAVDFCLKKDGDICRVAPGSTRCWAVSSSDLAPVAIALEARVRLASVRGERALPVRALFRDDGIAHLDKAPDEILVDVALPRPDGMLSTYLKLRRRGSTDFPVLGIAIAARIDPDGRCDLIRIVVGAVAPSPIEIAEAERILSGNRLTDDLIEQAAEAVFRAVKPMDNTDLTPYHRKRVARLYVRRALMELRRQARTAP